MEIIKIKHAFKSYGQGEEAVNVLKNINLSINEGEFLVILGPSGSGKSTLLNMIGGLDALDSGDIVLNGKNYKGENDKIMSRYRRKTLGFIFQSFNLIPVLSIYENVILPITLDNGKVDKEYVDEILDFLGIKNKKKSFPSQLSGGQQQRVAIARALSNKPKIILADEPTGNLDTNTGNDVLKLLLKGIKKYGQTLIMITHNERIAKLADRVVYIENGELVDKN